MRKRAGYNRCFIFLLPFLFDLLYYLTAVTKNPLVRNARKLLRARVAAERLLGKKLRPEVALSFFQLGALSVPARA